MKKVKYLKGILAGVLSLTLIGCGNNNTKVKDNDEETKTEAQAEEKKEEKVATRSNPVKLDETLSVNSSIYGSDSEKYDVEFDLSVEEVIRGEEAFNKLKEMNEWNEEAPQGYEWMLAKVKVTLTDAETEDHAFSIDYTEFTFVSESGDIYSGDIYGTTDPEVWFEMYKGNEKEGYVSGLVKTGESATLRYQELFGAEVFFALQ